MADFGRKVIREPPQSDNARGKTPPHFDHVEARRMRRGCPAISFVVEEAAGRDQSIEGISLTCPLRLQ